jgi:peptide/nickel transport system ATP-binding protein
MGTPLLDVSNLTVAVGEGASAPRVLTDISFTLEPRGILGVIGGSGAGKSVLAKAIINWLESPLRVVTGKVMFEGRDILTMSDRETRLLRGKAIGYVGGNHPVHWTLP